MLSDGNSRKISLIYVYVYLFSFSGFILQFDHIGPTLIFPITELETQ